LTEIGEYSVILCIFVRCLLSQSRTQLQSYLHEKSNCNLLAAQLLHEHARYAAVPHCAYYACLQQIKYILCVKFGKYCEDSELSGKSTHVVIWNEFLIQEKLWNKIYQTLTNEELVSIKKNFDLLKLNRIECDYNHHRRCTIHISEKSMDLAIQIRHFHEKLSIEF
jgi:hypothetical protein